MSGLSHKPEGYDYRMAQRSGNRSRTDSPINPSVHGEAFDVEVHHGDLVHAAADRLAALLARATRAGTVMIHLVEGRNMRLIGGYALPAGFTRMESVPAASTLAGLVIH